MKESVETKSNIESIHGVHYKDSTYIPSAFSRNDLCDRPAEYNKQWIMIPTTTSGFPSEPRGFLAVKQESQESSYGSINNPEQSAAKKKHRESKGSSAIDKIPVCQRNKRVKIPRMNSIQEHVQKSALHTDSVYYCGGCMSHYKAISDLHEHLQSHREGGSYFYNHHTRTAYPKFEATCKDTQTVQIMDEVLCLNDKLITDIHAVDKCIETGNNTYNYQKTNNDLDARTESLRNGNKENCTNLEGSHKESEERFNSVKKIKVEVQKSNSNEMSEVGSYQETFSDSEPENAKNVNNQENTDRKHESEQQQNSPGQTTAKTKHKPVQKTTVQAGHKQKAQICCKICQLVCIDNKFLKLHIRTSHWDVEHICKVCSQPLGSEDALLDHRRLQHAKKFHQCELCSKVLSSPAGLESHYLVHRGQKPFSCNICQRQFTLQTQLRSHMQTHSVVKNLQCEYCGKAFSARHIMTNHVKYCGGIKHYKCDFCDEKFIFNYVLQRHRRKHTGEKPFVCEVCAYASSRKSCLIRHMRTHTGEKPFCCKICGQNLTSSCGLRKHTRIHTKEKPFVCLYCNKGFSQRWNLKTHERQHTGEAPYACTLCGEGFKQNVLLKSHMKTHYYSEPVAVAKET